MGLGYLPDVQFAPFYSAAVEGLYEAEGLEVTFQHGFVTELYPLLAQGKLDFVVGDAEDVIALRAQNEAATPFKYIMAMYQQVPSVLFALGNEDLQLDTLAGRTIGMPGLFGSSYTSLQAVLQAAGLSETDIVIEEIGFTQLEAVLSKRVDLAMGFVNNEPIILRQQGQTVTTLPAGQYNPSAGNGIITTDTMLEQNADLARRFVAASQRGLALVIDTPDLAFEASKSYVENLDDDRMEVLAASADLYQSDYTKTNGIGTFNPEGFSKTLELLNETGRIQTNLSPDSFYTLGFTDASINPK